MTSKSAPIKDQPRGPARPPGLRRVLDALRMIEDDDPPPRPGGLGMRPPPWRIDEEPDRLAA